MTMRKSSELEEKKWIFLVRKETWLILIPVIVYLIALIVHFIYVNFINSDFGIIIADQVVLYNRGKGILFGLIPFKDFNTDAAPLSPYLWSSIILVSMIGSNDYSNALVNYENFENSNSMMLSSYVFRIFFVITIILSAVLLYRLELKRKNKYAFPIALIYSINPFFLHLVTFWGSDECILPFLILLPIYLYERGNKTLGTFFIGLGVGLKYFPVFIAPVIWIYSKNWKERIVQTLFFLIISVSSILSFYLIAPDTFFLYLKDPIQAPGNQGILTIIQNYFVIDLEQHTILFQTLTAAMVCFMGLILFIRRDKWSYHQTAVLLLTYLLFYQKFQLSYIVIIFPFIFVAFFEKGLIKWISISMFTIGAFYGLIANYLINGILGFHIYSVLAWCYVTIFYSILISLAILFAFCRFKTITI
jgi:hypothetical protein